MSNVYRSCSTVCCWMSFCTFCFEIRLMCGCYLSSPYNCKSTRSWFYMRCQFADTDFHWTVVCNVFSSRVLFNTKWLACTLVIHKQKEYRTFVKVSALKKSIAVMAEQWNNIETSFFLFNYQIFILYCSLFISLAKIKKKRTVGLRQHLHWANEYLYIAIQSCVHFDFLMFFFFFHFNQYWIIRICDYTCSSVIFASFAWISAKYISKMCKFLLITYKHAFFSLPVFFFGVRVCIRNCLTNLYLCVICIRI